MRKDDLQRRNDRYLPQDWQEIRPYESITLFTRREKRNLHSDEKSLKKLDIRCSICYTIIVGERGKRNSPVAMRLQKSPIGLNYHILC